MAVRYCYIPENENSECYQHVRDYVKNGFPDDSIYRDVSNDGKKMPKKLYQDYNSRTGKNDYDDFPRDVKEAARWRDGMVYSDALYHQNMYKHGGIDWARMYKEKCKIVFLYEQKKQIEEERAEEAAIKAKESGSNGKSKGKKRKAHEEEEEDEVEENNLNDLPCCPKNGHSFVQYSDSDDEDDDEDDDDQNDEEESKGTKKAAGVPQTPSSKPDKPPRCTCLTALNNGYLMDYYCSDIEGGQSQSLMRFKIFLMIKSEVENIPKTVPSKATEDTKCKYIHTVLLILDTLQQHMHWILTKVYGGEDLAFLSSTCTRIQSVLHYLVKAGFFDGPDSRGMLAVCVDCMESIEDEMGSMIDHLEMDDGTAMKPLWKKGVIQKYKDLVNQYHAKYRDAP